MKFAPQLLLVTLASTSFALAEQAPQPESSAPGWLQSQTTDTVRGYTYTRFTLAGKFLNAPQGMNAPRPALVVDCIPSQDSHASKGKFLSGSLMVGTTLKIVYVEPEEIHGMSYYPKVAVQLRTDARREDENWSPGTDNTSANIGKGAMKRILRARTVAITADDNNGSPVAMQFDMPDAKLVDQGCDVD